MDENSAKAYAYTKSNMRTDLGGRYEKRDLLDTNMADSEDLWQYAAQAGVGHSNARVKGTIAELTAVPYQVSNQNLPSSTFRGGIIPHSYGDMTSVDVTAEPDSQRMELNPFEFAGMVESKQADDDPFNIMVLRQKMRTSYALPPKPSVKYVDEKTNRTFLDTVKSARSNAGRNRNMTLDKNEAFYQDRTEAMRRTRAGNIFKNIDADQLASQFVDLASSNTWTQAGLKLGKMTMDTLNPDSALGKAAKELQRQGMMPNMLNDVLNSVYERYKAKTAPPKPKPKP